MTKHAQVLRIDASKRGLWVSGAIAAFAVVALLAWGGLRESGEPAAVRAASTGEGVDVWLRAGTSGVPVDDTKVPFSTGLERLPASLQGTEVAGELAVDERGNLKVTRGLRLMFDYFLSAAGEEPDASLRERVQAHLARLAAGAPAGAQALALFDRYVDYKRELARNLSGTRATSLSEMQARLTAVTALRARHFQPEVVAAFFGEDQAYDAYCLARVAILNDSSLSPAQKAARIAELRATQPDAVRQQMDVVETVQTLETLTTAWQQRAGSPTELRELRETLVGRDATDRLEALDRQNAAWDSRVAAYLQQRAQILGEATLADSMRAQQVEALRNQAFTGTERIRIETIERIQDSNARDAAATSRPAAPG